MWKKGIFTKPIYLLFLLIFMQFEIRSTCYKGTLKCDIQNEQPLICDFQNGYIKNDESQICEKIFIQNCLVYDFSQNSNFKCFLCSENMIYDSNSSKCIDIPSIQRIENCQFYDSSTSECLQCQPLFFRKNGQCLSVQENQIDNCIHYSEETALCSECEKGYVEENGSCIKKSTVENCLLHSNIYCEKCKTKHFKHFFKSQNKEFGSSLVLDLILKKDSGAHLKNDDQFHPVCKLNTMSKCDIQKDAENCEDCQSGYFLKSNGVCEEIPYQIIQNCEIYETKMSCQKCKKDYFLGADKNCYERLIIDNCLIYNNASNTCSLCENGFYLNGETGKCLEISSETMKNCKFNNPFENDCLTCEFGYFKTVFTTTQCLEEIAHCSTLEIVLINDEVTPTMTCYHCDEGFYLENNKCFPNEGILNCNHFDFEKNTCIVCEEGHDKKNEQCVVSSNTEHCFVYSNGKCHRCNPLYYFNIYELCVKIDSYENCINSEGYYNECSECNIGYEFNSNGACVEIQNFESNGQEISNCILNNDDPHQLSCSKCRAGSKLAYSDFWHKSSDDMNTMNCLKISDDGLQCLKCLPFHKFVNGVCTPQDQSTDSCKYYGHLDFVDGDFVPCEICNHAIGYEITSINTNCQLRSNPSSYFSCKNYSVTITNSSCLECEENTFPISNDQVICLNKIKYQNYAKSISNNINFEVQFVEHCLIFDLETKCHECKKNYSLSSDGLTCEEIPSSLGYELSIIFDSQMNISKSRELLQNHIVSNCQKYSQINEGKLGCSKCKSGYVGIINIFKTDSSTDSFDFIETVNNEGISSGSWNPFIKCEKSLDAVYKNDGNKHVQENDCAIGINIESFEGYICIKCIEGKIATLTEITKDLNDNFFAEDTFGLGDCVLENSNSMSNTFKAAGYHMRFNSGFPQLSNYIQFTKCSDSSKKVFYMFKTDLTNPSVSWIDQKMQNGDDLKEASCLNPSTALISNKIIDNCAIYAFNSLPSQSLNFGNNSIDGICIDCMPGFKAMNISKGIGTCQKISDCNSSSSGNIWLGSCASTTNNSWFAETIDDVTITKYEEPVSNEHKISNCILIDLETKSKCLMCSEGFSANSLGGCTQISEENSLCEEPSFGISQLNILKDGEKQNKQIVGNYFARHSSLSDTILNNKSNSFCDSCTDGNILVFVSSEILNEGKICGKSSVEFEEMNNKNCKNFNPSESDKCLRCKTGFALDENNNCVSSSISNCKEINNSSQCIECNLNYEIDENGQCVLLNCKVFEKHIENDVIFSSKGDCKICKDNHISFKHFYQPLDREVIYCKPNEDSESDCLNYMFSHPVCVKCKNPEKINFTFDFDIDLEEEISQLCIFNPKEQDLFNYINLEYFFLNAISDYLYLLVKFPEYDSQKDKSYSMIEDVQVMYKDFCVYSHNVENCSTGGTYSNPKCSFCDDFFFFKKSNNSCIKSTLPNCIQPSTNDESCILCKDNYFNSENECVERVKSKNICKTESLDEDSCESCYEYISYLNAETKLCVEYTVSNCVQYEPSVDGCVECREGYRRRHLGNNLYDCESLEHLNCRFFSEEQNKCTICKKNYFLKDNICEPYTVSNCESFDRFNDKCLICKNGFYYSFEGNCEPNVKDPFCSVFYIHNQGCKICREGYFLDQETLRCSKNPTGIKDCVEYSSEENCNECRDGFFLHENECFKISKKIPNCRIYLSAFECKTCYKNFFLIDNECKEMEATGCDEFISFNKCKNCRRGFYYDKNLDECLRITIPNCAEVNPLIPSKCMICDNFYIFDKSSSQCLPPVDPISNCLTYYNTESCQKCQSNFILSEDKTKCIPMGTFYNFANCDIAFKTEKLYCLECQTGYYLGENFECYQMPMKGCLSFDWKLNICELCFPGYYMDEFGLCHQS